MVSSSHLSDYGFHRCTMWWRTIFMMTVRSGWQFWLVALLATMVLLMPLKAMASPGHSLDHDHHASAERMPAVHSLSGDACLTSCPLHCMFAGESERVASPPVAAVSIALGADRMPAAWLPLVETGPPKV